MPRILLRSWGLSDGWDGWVDGSVDDDFVIRCDYVVGNTYLG